MKIIAKERFLGATDPVGVNTKVYEKDTRYDVHDDVATVFIEGNLADPVADDEDEDEEQAQKTTPGKGKTASSGKKAVFSRD